MASLPAGFHPDTTVIGCSLTGRGLVGEFYGF